MAEIVATDRSATKNQVVNNCENGRRKSARTRPQRRASSQRTRTHAQTRTDRRRHGLQGAAATGAELQARVRAGKMGAQPMTAGSALRIDTLHRPARQILHEIPPVKSARLKKQDPQGRPKERWRGLCWGAPVVSRKNDTRYRGKVAGGHSGGKRRHWRIRVERAERSRFREFSRR